MSIFECKVSLPEIKDFIKELVLVPENIFKLIRMDWCFVILESLYSRNLNSTFFPLGNSSLWKTPNLALRLDKALDNRTSS